MGGEVGAAGLDPDDAADRVEGDDVDDPEQILADPVGADMLVEALDDPADPALILQRPDRPLGR